MQSDRETTIETKLCGEIAPFDLSRWQSGGDLTWPETCFSSFWHTLPEVGKSTKFDGFSVSHRHAAYKQMITSTGGEALWGPDCEHHFLWAYSAQLDWQQRSARLSGPDAVLDERDTICPESWFGFMNYCFCICVLLGAADAGLLAQPTLTGRTSALAMQPGVRECTKAWESFWAVDFASFAAAAADVAGDEAALSELRETLQSKVWAAHVQTIDAGVAASRHLLDNLPPGERAFGLGWCGMVELLASINWSTSLKALKRDGAGYLPSRSPITDDWMSTIRISAPYEHATVVATSSLSDVPTPVLKLTASFWRRVARSRAARAQMPRTLSNLTYQKRWLPLALVRLLVLAAVPGSLAEAAVSGVCLVLATVYVFMHVTS